WFTVNSGLIGGIPHGSGSSQLEWLIVTSHFEGQKLNQPSPWQAASTLPDAHAAIPAASRARFRHVNIPLFLGFHTSVEAPKFTKVPFFFRGSSTI
ncbi:MAG: hypothetical protein L0Z53_23230, partial [Acidobacteriales bacterium]|nr:hypothetical protein [Terriglobales bacterium]